MKKITLYIFFLLPVTGLFFSCKQKTASAVDKNLFTGTWAFDEHLSFDQLKQMPDFKESLGVISNASMDIKGTNSFNSNGRYTMKGHLSLTMTPSEGGEEITMKFEFRETGTWKLADSLLTSITEEGDVMGADSTTRQMTEEDPDMLKEIRPKKGDATVDEIRLATAGRIELVDTQTKLVTTLKKQ